MMNASKIRSFARSLAGLLFLALVASGCSPEVKPTPKPVNIALFAATPTHVAAGGSATLTWKLEGELKRLELLAGAEVLTEEYGLEGSYEVKDLTVGSHRFVLNAYGADGSAKRADVEVVAVDKPTVVEFLASRSEAPAGSAIFLSWKTLLADRVELSAGTTVLETFTGANAATGTFTVRPTQATEYTLKATGLAGEATAKLNITVNAAPVFDTATLEPALVKAGESVTITWATQRATSLTLKDGARTLEAIPTADIASGSRQIVVTENRTFVLLAEGPGGTELKELPVQVAAPARIERFVADTTEVVFGGNVNLTWQTSGADTLELTANGEAVDLGSAGIANGTIQLSPVETTYYELMATGVGGDAVASLTVTVHGAPVIVDFDITPRHVHLRRDPAILSWKTAGAIAVTVTTGAMDVVDLRGKAAAEGSVEIFPTVDTTYTLTAVGPGGSISSMPISVTVSEPPPLVELSLLRNPVNRGMTSELAWRIVDADTFSVEQSIDGGDFETVDTTGKKFDDAIGTMPTATTIYRVTATNSIGETVKTATQTVVNPPAFKKFEVNAKQGSGPGAFFVTLGEPFSFEWEATDSEGVMVDPPAEYIADKDPFVSIADQEGTVELTVPSGTTGNLTIAFPDSFKFPYFGTDYDSVRMVIPGYLCFGSLCGSSATGSSQDIPNELDKSSNTPNGVIAAFWDGLKSVAGTTRWMYRIDGIAPFRKMTFEWYKMDINSSTDDGEDITFQAVLFESGLWEIRHAPRVPGTKNPGSNRRWGTKATIGIESPLGTSALKVSFESAAGLCASYVAGTGSGATGTPGQCDQYTRIRPKLLPPVGSTSITMIPENYVRNSVSFFLRAFGPLGSVKSTEYAVTIARKPTITSFTTNKTHVGAGESVVFSWTAASNPAADFDRIEIRDGNGVALPIPASESVKMAGSYTHIPTETTTYTLVVMNDAGFEVKSTPADDEPKRSRTVVVGAPTLVGAKVTPTIGAMLETYDFTWTESVGLSAMKVYDPDGVLVHTATSGQITSRSIKLATLTKPGTYRLEASNSSGATSAQLPLDIHQEVKIVSFASNFEELTSGRDLTLSWETYNGKTLVITGGSSPENIATESMRRGSMVFKMPGGDVTFTLTLTGAGGEVDTRTVTVRAAPTPAINSFGPSTTPVVWGTPFNLAWNTSNTTAVWVERIVTAEQNAPTTGGPTVGEAIVQRYVNGENQPVSSVPMTLEKPAQFRIIAENRVGDRVSQTITVTPSAGSPTLTFESSPNPDNGETVPRGGYVDLSWTATQVEGVKLWQRAGTEDHQVPYAYKPFGFIDISKTGTDHVPNMKLQDTSGTPNYRYGFVTMQFPDAFRPTYFGVKMVGMLISASGVITLSDELGSLGKNGCNAASSSTNACTSQSVTFSKAAPNAFLAPFMSDLSACAGKTTGACTTHPLGKVLTQLIGTAPNRTMIVQWDNWDFASASQEGTITMQVQIHENGDVEYQYKRLYSKYSAQYSGGGYAFMGLESPVLAGDVTQGMRIQATGTQAPFLSDGDGYRFYTGLQPRTGNVRSLFQPTTTPPPKAQFRATASNASGSIDKDRSIGLTHGVGELFITELMIDPSATNDVDKEWIEIRNFTINEANLKGYTIQTASSFMTPFTFTTNVIIPPGGSIVLAQNGDSSLNGGVAVMPSAVYGTNVRMNDTADTVILRYGDVLIDRVEYDRTAGWNVPREKSMMLDPRASSEARAIDPDPSPETNDHAQLWCPGYIPDVEGSTGSPGATNANCLVFTKSSVRDPTTDIETNPAATRVILSTGISTPKLDYPIGFAFPYFGTRYSTINISGYGYVAFGQLGSLNTSPGSLPSSSHIAGIDTINPYWTALSIRTAAQRTEGAGAVYAMTTGTPGSRRFIVHWAGFRNSSTVTSGNVDFSLVLTEEGDIEFHYKEREAPSTTGVTVSIGMQAFFNTFALQAFTGTTSSNGNPFSQFTSLSELPGSGGALKLIIPKAQ